MLHEIVKKEKATCKLRDALKKSGFALTGRKGEGAKKGKESKAKKKSRS